MNKVREFRTRAAECRILSEKVPTPDIRMHYLDLAKMWEKLAEERLRFFDLTPNTADDEAKATGEKQDGARRPLQ